MKFSIKSLENEESSGIDLTSMIDVLFVLLLFFMVTTTFANYNNLSLNLPTATLQKQNNEQKENKEITLTITSDKKIFLNEKNSPSSPLLLENLEQVLLELKTKNPEINLNLLADKNTDHGTVVSILDKTKKAGIENIGIGTLVKEGS